MTTRSRKLDRERKKRAKVNSRIQNAWNPQPIIDGTTLIGMWYPAQQRAIFIADKGISV